LFVRKTASYFAKPVFEADRDEDVPLHKLLQRRSAPSHPALCSVLFLLSLSKTHTGTAAVFVDELYAR
jgi:hypothetical protein